MVYAHALEDEREAGIHAFDDMVITKRVRGKRVSRFPLHFFYSNV